MKPTDTAQEQAPTSRCSFMMEEIYQSAYRAAREALAQHKARGQSVVVWQDGRVVTLKPEEIDV